MNPGASSAVRGRECNNPTMSNEFDDVFDVHVTIAALERVTFQMAYLLTVGDVAHVTGVTVHGCITSDGRATRMPKWLTEFGVTT